MSPFYRLFMVAALVFGVAIFIMPSTPLRGESLTVPNYTVRNLNDSGGGSLRDAITLANAQADGATIRFQSSLTGTLTLLTALPSIKNNITITGTGAKLLTIARSSDLATLKLRIFNIGQNQAAIDQPFNVALSGMTITNGDEGCNNCYDDGNLPTNNGNGATKLTIRRAPEEAPLFMVIRINSGTVNLTGLTITGGSTGAGGGITTLQTTVTTITACHITGNRTGTASSPLDPKLAPLNYYGGTTPTYALLSISPAVNKADPNNPLATDQRGLARTFGGRADIGAFKLNFSFAASQTGAGGAGTLPNGSREVSYNVQFSATRAAGLANYRLGIIDSINPFDAANLAGMNYTISDGALPPGLTLNPTNDRLSGSPTSGGTYNFVVKATDTADWMSGAQRYTLFIVGPTAANISIGGRVSTPVGAGLRNAVVVLTNSAGETSSARTTTFGYYRFNGLPAGGIYVIEVRSKLYTFAPQVVQATDDLTDVNFNALP